MTYEPWKASNLFIHDNGEVLCGDHMGVESTYQPQAWSDLGPGPAFIHEGTTFKCEDVRCERVHGRSTVA